MSLKNSGKSFESVTQEIGPDGALYRIATVYAGRKGKGKARDRYQTRKRVASPAMVHLNGLALAKVLGL